MSERPYNHIFDAHWQLYQTILQEDYMGHQSIYGVLQSYLAEYVGATSESPLAFLDIGSGDAQFISQHVQSLRIKTYTAIDLSADALAFAEQNLATLQCELELLQCDFVQGVADLIIAGRQFDVIFTGFALHHLQDDDKALMFTTLRQLLSPNGVLLYIDVCRREGESRDDYLERYLAPTWSRWHALDDAQTELLNQHVRSSDFPATRSLLESMAAQAGFTHCECLLEDDEHANILLAMHG